MKNLAECIVKNFHAVQKLAVYNKEKMMKESRPLISCIVAIYNVEKYLERCIKSFVTQNYENIELILVNDGSTDCSINICEKYACIDNRIMIINQENKGANSARNAGLKAAQGTWVYFADGDDYVRKDIFTAIDKYFIPNYQMILFSNERVQHGNNIVPLYPSEFIEFVRDEDFVELSLATLDRFSDSVYNYKILDAVSIWNKVYNREFLVENELYFIDGFPKLQDLSFNLLVYQKCKNAMFVNHVGYVYQINEGSVSKRYQSDFLAKMDVMIKWFTEFVSDYGKEKRWYAAYCGRVIAIFRTAVILYFCNSQNKKSYKNRKKEFDICCNKYISVDYKKIINLKNLPAQERILTIAILNRWFWLCEILNGIRTVIENR